MIGILLIGLCAALSDATYLAKFEDLREDVEEFKVTCPITGYTVKGYGYSRCSDGKTKPLGCVSSTGEKYRFGDEFVDSNAKYRCMKVGQTIVLQPIACVLNGKVLEIGQRARYHNMFVECSGAAGGVVLMVTGCITGSDMEAPVGTNYIKGSFVYKCEDDGERVYERAIACLVDNKWLQFGDTFRRGDFIMQCQRKGSRLARLEIIGCSDEEGRLLGPGDAMVRGMIIYRCEEEITDEFKAEFTLVPAGCRARDFRTKEIREYNFGDQFLQRFTDDIAVTMQCRQHGDMVGTEVVGCIFFEKNGDSKNVDIGCAKEQGQRLLICKSAGDGKVMARRKKIRQTMTVEQLLVENSVQLC